VTYVTTMESLARETGLIKGIEVALRLKFGERGMALPPEIRQLEGPEKLETILDAVETAASPEELRRLWAD
jgi:hypothetical protein